MVALSHSSVTRYAIRYFTTFEIRTNININRFTDNNQFRVFGGHTHTSNKVGVQLQARKPFKPVRRR